MIKLINKQLKKKKICKKYNIPLQLTTWKKFNYLKYQIQEIWEQDFSLKVCYDIFGLYQGKDFYLLMK